MASGIKLGSSFRLTSPIPVLANASFASTAARLAAGQLRNTAWDYHEQDSGTYWRIKPQAQCFTADGGGALTVPVTQAGTWGTLPIHWTQQGSVPPSGYDEVTFTDTEADFPAPGLFTTLYISRSTNFQYRWTGEAYAKLSDSGLTANELAAVQGGTDPSGANPFVTKSDIGHLVRTVNSVQPDANGNVAIVVPAGNGGTAGVNSVNARQGDVVLGKSDVGLPNVDNTSDLAKPISTAVQAALDAKVGARPFVYGQASKAGELVYNSSNDEFLVLQAIANPQTAPAYPLSTGLAPYYQYLGGPATAARLNALEQYPASLEHAGVTVLYANVSTALQFAVAGDTVRVRRTVDLGTGQYFVPAGSTLVIEDGASLKCKGLFPLGVGTVIIRGGGQLTCDLSCGPTFTGTLRVSGLGALTGQINVYNFNLAQSQTTTVQVRHTRWTNTTALFSTSYQYIGRQNYANVEVVGCWLECTADDLFSYLDESGKPASDAAAVAANVLRLEGNVIKGVAGKRVLNDDAGWLTLLLAGNTYQGVTAPAQTYAQLLPVDSTPAAPAPLPDTLAYAATTAVDFTDGPVVRTLTLAGNVAFTTTNRSNGREKVLRILADGADRTLNFPSTWDWYSAIPTTLAANKRGILSLTCFGPSDSDVAAAYSTKP